MLDRRNPTPCELAHEDYLNHLVRCRGCWAPTKRYCCTGRALRVEFDAHYMLTLPDLYQRRALLAREDTIEPAFADEIRARATVLFELAKEKAQEVVTNAA